MAAHPNSNATIAHNLVSANKEPATTSVSTCGYSPWREKLSPVSFDRFDLVRSKKLNRVLVFPF
jgi:hypothetical protein